MCNHGRRAKLRQQDCAKVTVQVEREVVLQVAQVPAKLHEALKACRGINTMYGVEVRRVFDQLRERLFNDKINPRIGKAPAQHAKEWRGQNDIANRAQAQH